jgi:hypothetical protein
MLCSAVYQYLYKRVGNVSVLAVLAETKLFGRGVTYKYKSCWGGIKNNLLARILQVIIPRLIFEYLLLSSLSSSSVSLQSTKKLAYVLVSLDSCCTNVPSDKLPSIVKYWDAEPCLKYLCYVSSCLLTHVY